MNKYIWNLESNNIKPNIQWKVVDKVYVNTNSGMRKLCLIVKLWIINHLYYNSNLNKKPELTNKC